MVKLDINGLIKKWSVFLLLVTLPLKCPLWSIWWNWPAVTITTKLTRILWPRLDDRVHLSAFGSHRLTGHHRNGAQSCNQTTESSTCLLLYLAGLLCLAVHSIHTRTKMNSSIAELSDRFFLKNRLSIVAITRLLYHRPLWIEILLRPSPKSDEWIGTDHRTWFQD